MGGFAAFQAQLSPVDHFDMATANGHSLELNGKMSHDFSEDEDHCENHDSMMSASEKEGEMMVMPSKLINQNEEEEEIHSSLQGGEIQDVKKILEDFDKEIEASEAAVLSCTEDEEDLEVGWRLEKDSIRESLNGASASFPEAKEETLLQPLSFKAEKELEEDWPHHAVEESQHKMEDALEDAFIASPEADEVGGQLEDWSSMHQEVGSSAPESPGLVEEEDVEAGEDAFVQMNKLLVVEDSLNEAQDAPEHVLEEEAETFIPHSGTLNNKEENFHDQEEETEEVQPASTIEKMASELFPRKSGRRERGYCRRGAIY